MFQGRRQTTESIINLARTAATPEELVQKWEKLTELDDVHCGKTGRCYKTVL
jgi:uncharacterized protein (DUF433 family)